MIDYLIGALAFMVAGLPIAYLIWRLAKGAQP